MSKYIKIIAIALKSQVNNFLLIVGSIVAVTVSDPYAPGRSNRFLGICVQREGHGLRHTFTLRNVIDGQGKNNNIL